MPGQEIDADQALADIETDAEREQRERLEAQIKAKIGELESEQQERLAQNQASANRLLPPEERKQWIKENLEAFEQPDPETERECEVHWLKVDALHVIGDYGLHDLHERQEAKLAELQAVREQQAEQIRHLRGLELDADTLKLDALAEMESQEGYVPGKNEEQRKRQRDSWLATHHGYQQALRVVRAGEIALDGLALERHRIEDELGSLKSLIQIRLGELRLIASFVSR